MTNALNVTFLRDINHGGDAGQAQAVADLLAGFVAAAKTSLDLAIYDFRLSDPALVTTVVGALTAAAGRGVAVRIAYDAGKPEAGDAESFAVLQADPQLMHSKYVIRDGTAVWTGSTNFTDDAWTRQENNILTITSHPAAAAYTADFEALWTSGKIIGTGAGGAGQGRVNGHVLGWDFCPGDGPAVNAALAARVGAARQRLVIAAMVLTSHEVLAALAAAVDRGVPLTGIYDSGQMNPIVKEWKRNPHDAQVVADWTKVSAHLVHKASIPYTPTSVHNFMHLKVLISDATLTTGSYNFSANAEHNAENQVHLTDPATVTAYHDFLNAVIATYAHL